MKRILIMAGLVILALLLLVSTGIYRDRYLQQQKKADSLQERIDGIKPGKTDTIKLPADTIRLPGKPLKPHPIQTISTVDTLSCKGLEYNDSLITKDLSVWYTIRIDNGCVTWVLFDYTLKDKQMIIKEKIVPGPPQIIPVPLSWHVSAMATGWCDQSLTFGAGFTMPDGWGIHVQADPFRSRWGAGVTYVLK